MKRSCLALVLCAIAAATAFAQPSTLTATTPPAAHPAAVHAPPLTKDEVAEVSKAYADALKSNPDLLTDQADIKAKQKALQDAQKAYQLKLNDALVKADPSLADIVKAHPNLHPSMPTAPKPPKTPKPAKTPKTPPASTNAAPANPMPPAASN